MKKVSQKELAALVRAGDYATAIDRLSTVVNERPAVRNGSDAVAVLKPWATKPVEYFLAVLLDSANHVIRVEEVSKGLANKTLVHPREVFAPALMARASAIIIAHNHPSGQLEASEEDWNTTRRLKAAGDLLGITVLDSIIISRNGFASAVEAGQM